MTAQVHRMSDYAPLARSHVVDAQTEPATIIILPAVPIKRLADGYVRKWRGDVRDDGLPSDSQR